MLLDVPAAEPEDEALRLGSAAHPAQRPLPLRSLHLQPLCESSLHRMLVWDISVPLAVVGIVMAALSALPLMHAHAMLPAN